MLVGTLFALAAGLMWGLVFVGPLILNDYPVVMLAFGRYLAFGLIALPLGWLDRASLRQFSRADWLDALKLSLVGNVLYYLFLASALQRAGGPLPSMIIGTLPVLIAIVANRRNAARDGLLPWRQLAPALVLIALGLACVNQSELHALLNDPHADLGRYALGAVLALGALVCWTWYPIRNADWLRHHSQRSPRSWATAQGLMTLPLALLGFALTWAWLGTAQPDWPMPLGPRPGLYAGMMLAIGLLASWAGTLCWNEASQRLPTSLAGQLIVFETLSALTYAYLWRGSWPDGLTLTGVALLIVGVSWGVRVKPVPESAEAPH